MTKIFFDVYDEQDRHVKFEITSDVELDEDAIYDMVNDLAGVVDDHILSGYTDYTVCILNQEVENATQKVE